MIQNAMFMQDVAAPALPQSGRASSAATGAAGGGGGFANLLSGKQASQAQAQGGETPAGDATAASGQAAQAQDQTGTAAGPGGTVPRSTDTKAQAAMAAKAGQTADERAVQLLVAQAEDPAQFTAVVAPDGLMAGAAQNTKNPQPTEGRVQETDRKEDGPLAVCTSLAADAQQIALAAQLALATLKPQDTTVAGSAGAATDSPPALEAAAVLPALATESNQAAPAAAAAPGPGSEAANPQAGVQVAALHGAVLPAAANLVEKTSQPQEPTAASGQQQATNQAASGSSRPALQAYGPFAQARQSAAAPQGSQPIPSGNQGPNITVLGGSSAARNAELDAQRAAVPTPEVLQPMETPGAAVRNAAAATPETGSTVAAAPAVPAAASAGQQVVAQAATEQQESTAATTEGFIRQAPATAEGKATRAAHGGEQAVKVAAQQEAGSTQASAPDATGPAAPATQARSTAFQGFSGGQQGSGSSDQKDNSEQKAQQSAAATPFPGAGPAPEASAASSTSEAKPTHSRDQLHESILSQVRDGVVRHDGKGNGEMSLRLNPGELGELKIQVRMEDNQLRVEVQADNKMVKDLLMSNLDSLKESLTSRNLTMSGFDVSTGGGFNSPLNEQQGNPQQQQSRSRLAQSGGYAEGSEPARVNYLNDEGDNLLNVRF